MSMRTDIIEALRGNGGMKRSELKAALDDGSLHEPTFLSTLSKMRARKMVVEDGWQRLWLFEEYERRGTIAPVIKHEEPAPAVALHEPEKAAPEPPQTVIDANEIVSPTPAVPRPVRSVPTLPPPPTAVLQLGPLRVEFTGPRALVQSALAGVTNALQGAEW